MPASTVIADGVLRYVADTSQLSSGVREVDQALGSLDRRITQTQQSFGDLNTEALTAVNTTDDLRTRFARFGAMNAGVGFRFLEEVSDQILPNFSRKATAGLVAFKGLAGAIAGGVGVFRRGAEIIGEASTALGKFTGFLGRGLRQGHEFILFFKDYAAQIRLVSNLIEQYWRPALAGFAAGITALSVEAVRVSERFASFDARLRLLTGTGNEFNESQQEILRVARETGTELALTYDLYIDVYDAVAQVGRQSSDTAKIVEALGRSFRVSGTIAGEQSRGIRQFLQALRSDPFLRAQEFDTLAETNPRLIRLLREEFAPELGAMGVGLRRLVTDGLVPMTRVIDALILALPELIRESESMGNSLSASFTRIRNAYQATLVEIGRDSGLLNAVQGLADTLTRIVSSTGFRTFVVDIGKELVAIAAASALIAESFLSWYEADPAAARETLSNLLLLSAAFINIYWAVAKASPALFKYFVIWKGISQLFGPILLPFVGVFQGLFRGVFNFGVGFIKALVDALRGFDFVLTQIGISLLALGRTFVAFFTAPLFMFQNLGTAANLVRELIRSIGAAGVVAGSLLKDAWVLAILPLLKVVGAILAIVIAIESLVAAMIQVDGFWSVLWRGARIFLARILIYTQEAIAIMIQLVVDLVAFVISSAWNLTEWLGRILQTARLFFFNIFRYDFGTALRIAAADLFEYFDFAFKDFIIKTNNYGLGGYRINIAPLFGLTGEEVESPFLGALRDGLDFVREALREKPFIFEWEFPTAPEPPPGGWYPQQPVPIVPPMIPGLVPGQAPAWVQQLWKDLEEAEKALETAFGNFARRGLSPYARALREIIDAENAARGSLLAHRLASARASVEILQSITAGLDEGASIIERLQRRVDEERIRASFASVIASAVGDQRLELEAQRDAQIQAIGEIATAELNLKHARETGNADLIASAEEALRVAKSNVGIYTTLILQALKYAGIVADVQRSTKALADYEAAAATGVFEARQKALEDYRIAVNEAERLTRDAQKRLADDVAQPFVQFLEDVLSLTQSISEAFKSLGRDILRLVVRQTISQPVAGFISNFILGLFNGKPGGGLGGGGYGPGTFRPGDGGNPDFQVLSKAAIGGPRVVVVEGAMNEETARRINEVEESLGDVAQYALSERRA